ncbi:unnamed protein product, partial [Didymodactylos carnosus]
ITIRVKKNNNSGPLHITEEDADRLKIIVFVNMKSGGLQGQQVFDALEAHIGKENVYDLVKDHGPEKGLKQNRHEKNLRIIACGGDGTVGWVLAALDKANMQYIHFVSVGIIPLGMGKGYHGENLLPIIHALAEGQIRLLDRWSVDVQPTSLTGDTSITLPQPVFNNYISFGADAQIALDFHKQRNSNPALFGNRMCNKVAYGLISTKTLLDRRYVCGNIAGDFQLIVDGRNMTKILMKSRPDALLILNISSYAAGTNPWKGVKLLNAADELFQYNDVDDSEFRDPSCSDGYLEIIGLKQYELARIHAGGRGLRIAQGSEIKLKMFASLPMEIDGEPFVIGPCQLTITRQNQARMIMTRDSNAYRQLQSNRV